MYAMSTDTLSCKLLFLFTYLIHCKKISVLNLLSLCYLLVLSLLCFFVWLNTVAGRQMCVRPSASWVKDLISYLETKDVSGANTNL
uniref:Chemokine interleukin-8-like domain-containing protein n=1 Tax=Xiphophorus couchianus TaxID=32473 RepID=A0A3B5N1T6_9TELE